MFQPALGREMWYDLEQRCKSKTSYPNLKYLADGLQDFAMIDLQVLLSLEKTTTGLSNVTMRISALTTSDLLVSRLYPFSGVFSDNSNIFSISQTSRSRPANHSRMILLEG